MFSWDVSKHVPTTWNSKQPVVDGNVYFQPFPNVKICFIIIQLIAKHLYHLFMNGWLSGSRQLFYCCGIYLQAWTDRDIKWELPLSLWDLQLKNDDLLYAKTPVKIEECQDRKYSCFSVGFPGCFPVSQPEGSLKQHETTNIVVRDDNSNQLNVDLGWLV